MILKIEKIYDDIAMQAFQNYSISRKNDDGTMENYRLAEIEIYRIDKANNINDIFIHKNEQQLENEKEYVHYSGFDICLGNGKDVYCGILVRGIMNDNEVVYGPGRVKYYRKNRKKVPRKIVVNYKNPYNGNLYFSTNKDNITDKLENVIFKLPRVNLSNSTSSSYLEDKKMLEQLNIYLNLKARYIRLRDEKFHTPKKNAPEESREIFNALLRYKKKILDA